MNFQETVQHQAQRRPGRTPGTVIVGSRVHDLDAIDQLVRFERMATRAEMAAEISHELKNMVGIVMLSLELVKRKLPGITPEEVEKYVAQALKSAQKIAGFSEALQSRARLVSNLVVTSPNRVITEFVDVVRAVPKFKNNLVTLSLEEGLPEVALDTDQITQVLLSLFLNAVHACPEASLRIGTSLDSAARMVRLIFSDNGPGFEESACERLFREKGTSKPDSHGYGLRICQQILSRHGGSITVGAVPGQGATVTLSFPLASPASS